MTSRRAIAALLGLVLVTAACGSAAGGDTDTSAAPAPGVEAAEPAPPATTEGDTTEGDTTEGDTTEGDTTDGDTTDGDTTEGDTTEGDTTEGDTTDGEVAPDPAAVPAALQFTAPLVGGGEIDAASLAGKPTVFWFWAPT